MVYIPPEKEEEFKNKTQPQELKPGVARPNDEGKQRVIEEFVPGKQITMAHIIASPDSHLYQKLGLVDKKGALGIFTITPGEAAIIAADIATKAGNVKICFVDRFNGALIITGTVADVQASAQDINRILPELMGFTPTVITKT